MRAKRTPFMFSACLLIILCILLAAALSACSSNDKKDMLTLDDVIDLSAKGLTLSWGDFVEYEYEAVASSRVTIWDFPIAEPGFSLSIDGGSVNEPPSNILLFNDAGDSIEIRTKDVEAFIAGEGNGGLRPEPEPEPQPPPQLIPPAQPGPEPIPTPPAQPGPEPIPTYSVIANPSSYDVSTESITVTITNTSSVQSSYGLNYRIERHVSGTWEKIPLNFVVPDILMMLPAGQTNTESFSLRQEQHDYQPGTYRIVFVDSLNGASAQFTLTGNANPTFSVSAEPQSYLVTAEKITVRITNTSLVEGSYGYSYRIESYVNGRWELIPLNFFVTSIATILPAGQTNTESFSLHQDQYDYQSGIYRIVFTDGLGGASAQFTLTLP